MKQESPEIFLKVYNTETREKEKLTLAQGESIFKIYTCGPTVYDFAHIGNFRTFLFEDVLRRSLKYFGIPIKQVMNLTDVEDKTLNAARKKGMSLQSYTDIYKKAFEEDCKTLGIEPPEEMPSATQHIEEMIQIIQKLMEKGVAYKGSDGSIFYRISTFPSYGRLSHFKLADLKTGASERVSEDEYDKESASDFVLWKSYHPERDGDVFWESPFGKGRPGWHIECSAMAIKHLGEVIDLHVGGVDNIFPHHENEIAQSEAATGKPFVRHWAHAEHLLVDGKKMSKSLGNFYTLRDLLEKGFSGREVRYALIQTHYRKQHNFTLQTLEAARQSLERIDSFIERLAAAQAREEYNPSSYIENAKASFKKALGDDLNISEALAALFDAIREGNSLIDAGKMDSKSAQLFLDMLKNFDTVLGVIFFQKDGLEIPHEVQEAMGQREEARKNRDFKKADHLRDLILSKGFTVEDTPAGPKLKKQ